MVYFQLRELVPNLASAIRPCGNSAVWGLSRLVTTILTDLNTPGSPSLTAGTKQADYD
jgi:hypothetical protein